MTPNRLRGLSVSLGKHIQSTLKKRISVTCRNSWLTKNRIIDLVDLSSDSSSDENSAILSPSSQGSFDDLEQRFYDEEIYSTFGMYSSDR